MPLNHLNEQIKTKKRKKTIILLLVMFILAGFVYVTYLLLSANSFLNTIQGTKLPETTLNVDEKIVLTNKDPFSVLLLGVDKRPGDVGRSDSIMVATINPETNDVRLLSIPRDTRVTLPSGKIDKINASYAYGGIPLTVETVENLLQIPIHYYAQINMQGLVVLVDALEGITVNSPLEFDVQDINDVEGNIHIDKGIQELNGNQALGYARMRYEDPQGDWGRQKRQREVVNEIIDETISLKSLTNFSTIFRAVGPNVETNFSSRDLWAIATNYANAADHVETLQLEGQEAYEYFPSYGQDVFVWQTDDVKLAELQQELQTHLSLEQDTQTDSTDLDSSSDNLR
ncbi:transcriptional attenuator, LytR family [Carnobacterium iners]|uniref:Transcriptional attenuator, LytR family n=1 Tax=Carnobacterium iners TaxID=1073423 RepID=A0A1X7MSI5_9LACT|nr:LCP family protein [Carnobacterium iners]SEL28077.1 transcriptional attenuator, LytR family [Carnobacterium iners]SMH26913.1 transcriptional attenuator, LytR family [Carnobacterium iners]